MIPLMVSAALKVESKELLQNLLDYCICSSVAPIRDNVSFWSSGLNFLSSSPPTGAGILGSSPLEPGLGFSKDCGETSPEAPQGALQTDHSLVHIIDPCVFHFMSWKLSLHQKLHPVRGQRTFVHMHVHISCLLLWDVSAKLSI